MYSTKFCASRKRLWRRKGMVGSSLHTDILVEQVSPARRGQLEDGARCHWAVIEISDLCLIEVGHVDSSGLFAAQRSRTGAFFVHSVVAWIALNRPRSALKRALWGHCALYICKNE